MNIPPLFAHPVVRVLIVCVVVGSFVLGVSMPIFRIVFAVAMGLIWCVVTYIVVQVMQLKAQRIGWRAVLKRPLPYLFVIFMIIQLVVLLRIAM